MKKLLLNTLVLASVVGVAACASTGAADKDETLTQAPYSESRTVGDAPAPVESADQVFDSKQVK